MKRILIFILLTIFLVKCSNADRDKKIKERNAIECTLFSVLSNAQSLPQTVDSAQLKVYLNNTMITNLVCTDYLNKKDGVK